VPPPAFGPLPVQPRGAVESPTARAR
jgi:hypothetical protein